jgi:hypothetical protein
VGIKLEETSCWQRLSKAGELFFVFFWYPWLVTWAQKWLEPWLENDDLMIFNGI